MDKSNDVGNQQIPARYFIKERKGPIVHSRCQSSPKSNRVFGNNSSKTSSLSALFAMTRLYLHQGVVKICTAKLILKNLSLNCCFSLY